MKRILIVDDDQDIREIMAFILREEGYEIFELDKGRDVVETVERIHPDLLLLDVMLGDSDGRDICGELKRRTATRNLPVIIVSASHGYHTRHEKNCGADDYLPKPFEIGNLVDQVRRYAA
ncbi:response regulator [Mucilaginibacter gossypii]|uniref:response regulator n=1 Tax=Mucilaginibacter gossypii TaxID=551996 RepID=UPI0015A12FDD|nr:response regulator [Mucilaginibacter gossypii]